MSATIQELATSECSSDSPVQNDAELASPKAKPLDLSTGVQDVIHSAVPDSDGEGELDNSSYATKGTKIEGISESLKSFGRSSLLMKIFSPGHGEAEEETEAVKRRKKSALASVFPCVFAPRGPSIGDSSSVDDHFRDLVPSYEPEAPLLPEQTPEMKGRITLVLDLDETLVHSSFSPISNYDYCISLDMGSGTHSVYVRKRPRVDHFLKMYANPVCDRLDRSLEIPYRLYREHCVLIGGCYVKDLSKLGRPAEKTIIIDNSALSYCLQPEQAIPIANFVSDQRDRELDDILRILEKAKDIDDVRNAYL